MGVRWTLNRRWRDVRELWEPNDSVYPQTGVVGGWCGFWLRIKASICLLAGWEAKNHIGQFFYSVPIWNGPLVINYADPGASWQEIGCDYRWWVWQIYRYRDGI